jgi:hypothetical protein
MPLVWLLREQRKGKENGDSSEELRVDMCSFRLFLNVFTVMKGKSSGPKNASGL